MWAEEKLVTLQEEDSTQGIVDLFIHLLEPTFCGKKPPCPLQPISVSCLAHLGPAPLTPQPHFLSAFLLFCGFVLWASCHSECL